MIKESYETLLNKIKLKRIEYERHNSEKKEYCNLKEKELLNLKEDEEKARKRELKEHIKDSYKSATKKDFYNKQGTADREKTFVGILAYGDKLKKSLYPLTDKAGRPKDFEDKKLLEEYKSCLTVYSNALGFTDDNPKKLMMVEKRFDRLGEAILDLAEKGKLSAGYEQDYLKIAENAIKSAQKVKYVLHSINQKIRRR